MSGTTINETTVTTESLYLSQLKLDSRRRDVQRDLRDAYEMHRTLARAWGEGTEYEAARVLFRVENGAGSSPIVLVQAKVAPKWERVPEGYLQKEPATKEWQPNLQVGQTLAFRLRANPTVKREGKRWGLYAEEQQHEWLERKAKLHGFALSQVTILKEGTPQRAPGRTKPSVRFWRESVQAIPQRDKGDVETERTAKAMFCAARFDGVLRVTDVEAFTEALRNGIGSAKGLGFGLLSIARL